VSSSAQVRLKVVFDRWAWPLVRRWFAFEIDSEFLRGVAFGRRMHEEEMRGHGNQSTGPSYNLKLSIPHKSARDDGSVDA
jgi:hypothetical protein